MIRNIGAQVGLLMFGLAIVAGLLSGNSAGTILWRALAAMVAASLIGQLAAWAAHSVLRDLADKTRQRIENEFHASRKAAAEAESQPEAETAKPGESIETAEAA